MIARGKVTNKPAVINRAVDVLLRGWTHLDAATDKQCEHAEAARKAATLAEKMASEDHLSVDITMRVMAKVQELREAIRRLP